MSINLKTPIELNVQRDSNGFYIAEKINKKMKQKALKSLPFSAGAERKMGNLILNHYYHDEHLVRKMED